MKKALLLLLLPALGFCDRLGSLPSNANVILTTQTLKNDNVTACGDSTHALGASGGLFTCQSITGSGGGGSSALQVIFGAASSSPTATITAPYPFTGTVAGSTITLGVDYSTFTMRGTPWSFLIDTSTAALRTSLDTVATDTTTLKTNINSLGVSTGSLQTQITATGVSTGTLSASVINLGASTGTLLTSVNNLGASTGTIRSDFNTSTATLQTNINSVGVATGTLKTNINSLGVSTGTIQSNFPVSLSTNTMGTLPAAGFPALTGAVTTAAGSLATTYAGAIGTQVLPSTIAYVSSTNTWTAQQTYNNTVIISTTIGLGGLNTVGTAGQVLTSQGGGSIPTWTTVAGTGDMILASTQTVSGAKTFLSSVTIANVASLPLATDASGNIISTGVFQPSSIATLTNKTIDAEAAGNTITIPFDITFKAGLCQASTATLGFSSYASSGPIATCLQSTSTVIGAASFVDSSTNTVQDHFRLPSDWTGNIDLQLVWTSSVTVGTVAWEARTACVSSGTLNAPTFNAYNTVNSVAVTQANAFNEASMTALTTTGCSANSEFNFEIARNGQAVVNDTHKATAQLITAMFTIRRAM